MNEWKSRFYAPADFARTIALDGTDQGISAHEWRSPFRRDLARLLHCPAFRRLQGKMQLFAGLESDFFRNRLTHSLEVAQIAKSIAIKLNHESLEGTDYAIDPELVEFAGLAHDVGHPPFGHAGEHALNKKMIRFGGFEGNAQTLRILCRLEKKLDDRHRQLDRDAQPIWFSGGQDAGVGLNLCYRTLAAVIKYDRPSRPKRESEKPAKGYYDSEKPIVAAIKRAVMGRRSRKKLRTVECQIMDLADDIAYSTYDMEDAFKAGFVEPLDLFFPGKEVLEKVADRTAEGLGKRFTVKDTDAAIDRVLRRYVFPYFDGPFVPRNWEEFRDFSAMSYQLSKQLAQSGFARGRFTSGLVDRFMTSISMHLDDETPSLSVIEIDTTVHEEIEVLKHLTYVMLIESHRMKAVAHRASHIVDTVFDALTGSGGHELMPPDFEARFKAAGRSGRGETKGARERDAKKKRARVVCDFVAGMTDRYAVEFYSRLTSESFQTIFRDY